MSRRERQASQLKQTRTSSALKQFAGFGVSMVAYMGVSFLSSKIIAPTAGKISSSFSRSFGSGTKTQKFFDTFGRSLQKTGSFHRSALRGVARINKKGVFGKMANKYLGATRTWGRYTKSVAGRNRGVAGNSVRNYTNLAKATPGYSTKKKMGAFGAQTFVRPLFEMPKFYVAGLITGQHRPKKDFHALNPLGWLSDYADYAVNSYLPFAIGGPIFQSAIGAPGYAAGSFQKAIRTSATAQRGVRKGVVGIFNASNIVSSGLKAASSFFKEKARSSTTSSAFKAAKKAFTEHRESRVIDDTHVSRAVQLITKEGVEGKINVSGASLLKRKVEIQDKIAIHQNAAATNARSATKVAKLTQKLGSVQERLNRLNALKRVGGRANTLNFEDKLFSEATGIGVHGQTGRTNNNTIGFWEDVTGMPLSRGFTTAEAKGLKEAYGTKIFNKYLQKGIVRGELSVPAGEGSKRVLLNVNPLYRTEKILGKLSSLSGLKVGPLPFMDILVPDATRRWAKQQKFGMSALVTNVADPYMDGSTMTTRVLQFKDHQIHEQVMYKLKDLETLTGIEYSAKTGKKFGKRLTSFFGDMAKKRVDYLGRSRVIKMGTDKTRSAESYVMLKFRHKQQFDAFSGITENSFLLREYRNMLAENEGYYGAPTKQQKPMYKKVTEKVKGFWDALSKNGEARSEQIRTKAQKGYYNPKNKNGIHSKLLRVKQLQEVIAASDDSIDLTAVRDELSNLQFTITTEFYRFNDLLNNGAQNMKGLLKKVGKKMHKLSYDAGDDAANTEWVRNLKANLAKRTGLTGAELDDLVTARVNVFNKITAGDDTAESLLYYGFKHDRGIFNKPGILNKKSRNLVQKILEEEHIDPDVTFKEFKGRMGVLEKHQTGVHRGGWGDDFLVADDLSTAIFSDTIYNLTDVGDPNLVKSLLPGLVSKQALAAGGLEGKAFDLLNIGYQRMYLSETLEKLGVQSAAAINTQNFSKVLEDGVTLEGTDVVDQMISYFSGINMKGPGAADPWFVGLDKKIHEGNFFFMKTGGRIATSQKIPDYLEGIQTSGDRLSGHYLGYETFGKDTLIIPKGSYGKFAASSITGRVNTVLNAIGLGVDTQGKSGATIMKDLLLTRILPLPLIAGGMSLADTATSSVLPKGLFGSLAGIPKAIDIGSARFRDATGITAMSQYAEGLMPGSVDSALGKTARIGAGALAFLHTAALVSNPWAVAAVGTVAGLAALTSSPTKSAEDLEKEYKGEKLVPIRKGRWWELCLIPGILVKTIRGFTPIEQILPGDEIITHKNNKAKIKAISNRSAEDYFKINTILSNFDELKCTGNHPIFTLDTNSKKGYWKSAESLTLEDKVLYPIPVKTVKHINFLDYISEDLVLLSENSKEYLSNATVYTTLQRTTKSAYHKTKSKLRVNSEGSLILTRNLGFLFGVYLGDGNLFWKNGVSYGIEFAFGEKDYVNALRVQKILKTVFDLDSILDKKKGSKMYRVRCFNRIIGDFFFNLFGKEKIIPEFLYYVANTAFYKNLLSGLIDSDGHISNNQIIFSNTNINIIHLYFTILLHLGYYGKISKKEVKNLSIFGAPPKNYKDCYKVTLNKGYSMKIKRRFRKNESYKIDLMKYSQYHQSCSRSVNLEERVRIIEIDNIKYLATQVSSIEKVEKRVRVYDICVDSDDHSFNLFSIAVHNSSTPFEGERIEAYVPNWFVRLTSRYKENQDMYGGALESFIHRPLPLIGISMGTFFDPYHYERCVFEETLIVTLKGIKKLKNIKINDFVLTHDNKFKKVLDTESIKARDIIEVKTSFDSLGIKTTPEHKYLVFKSKKCGKRKDRIVSCKPREWARCKTCKDKLSISNSWVRADEMTKLDYLAMPIPEFPKKEYIEKVVTNKYRKIEKLVEFSISDPAFFRLIGYYLAEGCTTKGGIKLTFNIKEQDYIDDIISIVKNNFSAITYSVYKYPDKGRTDIHIFNNVLSEYFKKYGKKEYKEIPDGMLSNLSQKQSIQLLLGFWRGDGSKLPNRRGITFANTSKILLKQLQFLLLKHKIFATFNIRIKARSIYRKDLNKVVNEKEAYVLNVLGEDDTNLRELFGLEDQFPRAAPPKTHFWHKGYLYSKLVKIDYLDKEINLIDLTIKDSHSFTGVGAVFHNSLAIRRPAQYATPAFADVPIIGPSLAATIGSIIKPSISMSYFDKLEQDGNIYDIPGKGMYTQAAANKGFVNSPKVAHVNSGGKGGAATNHPAPVYNPYGAYGTLSQQIYKGFVEPMGLVGWQYQTAIGVPGVSAPMAKELAMGPGAQFGVGSGKKSSFSHSWWNESIGGGVGTCFIPGTKIKTSEGPRRIEAVVIGDKVLTKGTYEKVIDVLEKTPKEPIVIIKSTSGGATLQCTGNHWIPVLRRHRYTKGHVKPFNSKNYDIVEIQAKEIKETDYLFYEIDNTEKTYTIDLKDLGKCYTSNYVYLQASFLFAKAWELVETLISLSRNTRKWLREQGIPDLIAKEVLMQYKEGDKIKRIKRFIPVTEEFAYFLGWFIAKGCVGDKQSTLTMHRKEKVYAQQLQETLKRLDINSSIFIEDNTLQLKVYSATLAKYLKVFGSSARNKKIPLIYKQLPRKILAQLVEGLILGDGWTEGFTSSSKQLALDLYDCLLKLKKPAAVYLDYLEKGVGCYPQGTKRKDCLRHYVEFRSPKASWRFIDNAYLIPVSSIEVSSLNFDRVYDLTIENLHHYTAEGVRVHNTEGIRRLFPRDVLEDLYIEGPYNPTMPIWLPSQFRRGDAFTAVKQGELRLPGGGYAKSHPIRRTYSLDARMLGFDPKVVAEYHAGSISLHPLDLRNDEKDSYIKRKVLMELSGQHKLIKTAALMYDPVNDISGTVDAIIKQEGIGKSPVSIKRLTEEQFAKLNTPLERHFAETQVYLNIMNAKAGKIIYVNDSSPEQQRVFDVKFDPDSYENIISSAKSSKSLWADLVQSGKGYEGNEFSWYDRMQILADVAPYSKEFKYARSIVSKLMKAGKTTEADREKFLQATEIQQHRARGLDTYERRFKVGQIFNPDVEIQMTNTNQFIKAASEYTMPERLVGALWEYATHSNNLITRKMVNRFSAEEYLRYKVLYGNKNAYWEHPIKGFITPNLTMPFAGGEDMGSAVLSGAGQLAAFASVFSPHLAVAAAFVGGAQGFIGQSTGLKMPRTKREAKAMIKTSQMDFMRSKMLYAETLDEKYTREASNNMYGILQSRNAPEFAQVVRAVPYKYKQVLGSILSLPREKQIEAARLMPEPIQAMVHKYNNVPVKVGNMLSRGHLPNPSVLAANQEDYDAYKLNIVRNEALDYHDFGLGFQDQLGIANALPLKKAEYYKNEYTHDFNKSQKNLIMTAVKNFMSGQGLEVSVTISMSKGDGVSINIID